MRFLEISMADSQRSRPGLVVRDLAKHFGGVQAVRGVDFSVQPGECVALIGPNGAGKSTTFACIAGQHPPSGGEVFWQGESLDALPTARRLQRGIARTFQVAQTFESLTVLQNMQLVLPSTDVLSPVQVLDKQPREAALALLARVGLQEYSESGARQLPYGAKKRLELAMALAGLDVTPGLLLLDEPAAGLAPSERAALMQLVRSLTQDAAGKARLAVLYTEHNMDAVFGVADRVLVLMEGRLVASGTANEVAANEMVRTHYLGRAFRHAQEATHA
jgi:branched-chain amino acid transport system ATP-binding protein